ncbi:prepilin-type N-terminal cleavage/methylation domain-containing protein [Halomonas sp.]|uniref:prepilin-type N-terminal cleavage/methylation domain-containing protein n=1 Tax=Halomonas sp. TaxID=1486246 RepID=UPI00298E45C9|nr:GspH/FimT family pseudopilin [Halomonas sp.]MDW7748147.1 GspH/FimT family pseudopilin [Halomonas sp.]
MKARSPQPSGGFSLLELMVVLAVMGVVASLGVAMMDRAQRQPLEAARELLQRDLAEAGDQAVQRQGLIGWQPGEAGYRFLAWHPAEGGQWRPLASRRLAGRDWPEGLTATRREPARESPETPWVVWWPDGEVVGTTLVLHHAGRRLELAVGDTR